MVCRALLRPGLWLVIACLACSEGADPSGPQEPGEPVLAVSQTDVALAALFGAPPPAPGTIQVSNTGEGTLAGLGTTVTYRAGQPAGWLSAALSATTAPATLTLTGDPGDIAPGSYSATVSVAGSAGGTRTVDVTLNIDAGSAPAIVVTSPARGAMVASASDQVQVTGRVCHDVAPITSIVVNDEAVPVSGSALCENFDVTRHSSWGLSTITVEAMNAYGRRAEHVQSYLRSHAFQVEKPVPDSILNGMFVQLNQSVLDDNDPALDDVAAFLTAAAPMAAQVYALMPERLMDQDVLEGTVPFCTDQLTVTRTGLSYSPPVVHVTAAQNVLNVSVVAQDVSIGLRVRYVGCLGNVQTVDGRLVASRVTAMGSSHINAAGHQPVSLSVQLTGSELIIDSSGFISAVTSLLTAAAYPITRGLFEDTFAELAEDQANDALDVMVNEFALTEAQIDVNGRAISARGGRSFMRAGVGHLDVGVAPRFTPVSPVGETPQYGAILGSPSLTIPALATTGFELAAGISTDALNQLAWAAWRAGAFDVPNIAAEPGAALNGLTGSATLLLPPVASGWQPSGTLALEAGELRITGHVSPTAIGLPAGAPIPITAYASAALNANVLWSQSSLSPGTITATVQVQVDAPAYIIDESALHDYIRNAATQLFRNAIADVIAALPLMETPVARLDAVTLAGIGPWLVLRGNAIPK